MTVDVHTYIGGYPFRHIPHPEPGILVRVLEREGVSGAWVGHLPSAYYRDPAPGNDVLFESLGPHHGVLHPAPTVRPDWPKWERALSRVVDAGAVALRAYPAQWGMGPHDSALAALANACGEVGIPLVLTVRFEDLRQRHLMETAGDLTGAAIRAVIRAAPDVRVVVLGAGRGLISEVHWGLTWEERARLWWDISWVWGPPEEDLAHLLLTCGAERFVYGSGWPLRLAQTPRASLALLPESLSGVALAVASDISASAREHAG